MELGLFLQPTLMHLQYKHVCHITILDMFRGLDMPILRRNNCTNTASGILALELSERSYIKLVQDLLCC